MNLGTRVVELTVKHFALLRLRTFWISGVASATAPLQNVVRRSSAGMFRGP